MDTLQVMLLTSAALSLLTVLSTLAGPRKTNDGGVRRNPLPTVLAALTLVAVLVTLGYSLVSGYSISITRNP